MFYDSQNNRDFLFVTLNKKDPHYTDSTSYHDYFISPNELHWESQSATTQSTSVGQRYINKTSTVYLFVQQEKKDERGEALPFIFLGPVTLQSYSGNKPIQIVWKLSYPMPFELISEIA